MIKLEATSITTSVHHEEDNPVFGESSTHITIDDEAGGPFIVLKQCHDYIKPGEVRLDMNELELICKVARKMVKNYPKEQT